jgi:Tfp pilus assembly protein PilF
MTQPVAPQTNRRRLRRPAKWLLAAGSFLVALLACESGVRWFALAPQVKPFWLSNEDSPDVVYRRSSNPILGFELKPDFRHSSPDQRTTYSRINSYGQRDVERTVEKPKGVRRVIVLGDSVVEGHGLPDLELTISRQLEKLYSDGKTQVLNFGVSGYCTRSEVELLETKGLKFEPDVVIVVFVENDFNNFSPEAFQLGTVVDRPTPVKHLFLWSHFFRLACIRFNLFRFGEDAEPLKWNQRAIGENNVVTGFERLRELAVEHDFTPLIAIWPQFADTEIKNVPLMPDGSGDPVAERVAEIFGLPSVRLSDWFERDWKVVSGKTNPREHYSVEGDQLHPNVRAAEVAAAALKSILVDLEAGKYALREPAATDAEQRAAVVEAALALGNERKPDYAMVYVNDGRAQEKAGNLEAAAALYNKALEADPTCFPAVNNLGVLFAREGRLPEAAKQFERALSMRPSSADVHNNLGNLLLAIGNVDEAAHHFEEALRVRPDYAEAHCNYSGVFVVRKETAKAREHLVRAIEIAPKYVKAYHNLGALLASNGDVPGAIEQFRRAVEIDANYAPGFANLGHLYLHQKQFGEAEKAYRRALTIDSNLPDAQQGLAQLQRIQAGPATRSLSSPP